MELWKTAAALASVVVAALALTYQVFRATHPMYGAHERAANALGLVKALSEVKIPGEDAESRAKSRGLQKALLDQSFLATQQYVDRAAPVLTNHWQTLVLCLMMPISFGLLFWNALGQTANAATFPVVIGAIFVVPLLFGIAAGVVYGRVVRYRATVRNLKLLVSGDIAKKPVGSRTRSRLGSRASRRSS